MENIGEIYICIYICTKTKKQTRDLEEHAEEADFRPPGSVPVSLSLSLLDRPRRNSSRRFQDKEIFFTRSQHVDDPAHFRSLPRVYSVRRTKKRRHDCRRNGRRERRITKKEKITRRFPNFLGDRPTVKCLIVQASGWTKVDPFLSFFFFPRAKRNAETIFVTLPATSNDPV